jgi:putative transposase
MYGRLAVYKIIAYYKLSAISHAAGILANRKKSLKRGIRPRKPYAVRPLLVSSYGFKIVDDVLKIPIGNKEYFDIPLNRYVKVVLSDHDLRIRSFLLTATTLGICYSKEVAMIDCKEIEGVDRNLRNVTVGSSREITQYDLGKAVDISANTRSIISSFKRNDVRVRKQLYRKYGMRRKQRVSQLLHRVTKAIVQNARQNRAAITFEDIRHIRRLYQKGNYQGNAHRGKLNSWSFAEVKRQIEYKASWAGVPTIQLSVKETRGTSQLCPRCGKMITQMDRKTRQLYCGECRRWMDRDVLAAMNLSIKGLARFASSQGLADEAVNGNSERDPVILRVDASKLICQPS